MGFLIIRSTVNAPLLLSAPTNISDFRNRLSDGLDRWAHWAFPGDDTNATFDYSRQNSTAYVVGEHIFVGNRGYVCTTAGTTAGSAPTFTNTTIRPKGSNSGGSTTTDGSVVWEYVLDVGSDFGGTSWDTGSRTYRVSYDAPESLWYYDSTEVCWQHRDYLDRLGTLTTAVDHKLQVYASYGLSNYLQKNATTGSSIAGYHIFTDGLRQDYQRTSDRYKYSSTITTADLLAVASTGSGWANPAAGHWTGIWGNDNAWMESQSREIAYLGSSLINYAKANGGTYRSVTIGGVTDNFMRWVIPSMLNHIYQWMNTLETPDGFAPFMWGLTTNTLIDWIEYETASGRDPDRYTSHANIGSVSQNFGWRTNSTAGVCQAWPTIAAALEDSAYFLRYTAVDASARSMFRASNSNGRVDYRYRRDDADGGDNVDLNNLIGHAFAWLADYKRANSGNTAWTAAGLMSHADDLFNACVPYYYYSTTLSSASYFYGKQFNEANKFAFKYLTYRNRASGRND